MSAWLDTPEGPAQTFDVSNGQLSLTVCEWGATILALHVPDRDGHPDDIVLAHREPASYLDNPGHLGCIAGRVANRIDGARARIDEVEHTFDANLPGLTLHGGRGGFHARLWRAQVDGNAVQLRRTSLAGEGGFPGRLEVVVTYALADSSLDVLIEAHTDAATLVNLAQHTYFNLGGHASGRIDNHELRLPAAGVLAVDGRLIPTGTIEPPRGALLLANWTRLGDHLSPVAAELAATLGYDHCYVVDRQPIAELRHPASGRCLTVSTDQPALQVYSAGHMDALPGKDGAVYNAHHGLALETQGFPNAANLPAFPTTVLRPGEVYRRRTRYAFGIDAAT